MVVTELTRILDSVSKDKGVNREVIVNAIEEAVQLAAERLFRSEGKFTELEVHFNEEDGEVELFEFKKVVEEVEDPDVEIAIKEAVNLDPEAELEDFIGVKISPEYTRIAIQNAKQKILQKLKEAEGKVIYEEFKTRKGELVGGIVRRIERRTAIVDLGKTEAILPPEHQVPKEYYKQKERVRAILIEIQESKKGPKLILSRAHPDFVKSLFEAEVPEISEGVMEIKAISRDAGSRTKIAVHSNDPDVDPIGACVGMRGARVQNIIHELRGEKIDIIPWSKDSARFVCNALSPARINKVIIDENHNAMEVVVDDDQQSLAIGRRGQNVRLASQLTGWKIDIKTETQLNKELQDVMTVLISLPNISDVTAKLLYNEGYHTLEDIAFSDPDLIAKAGNLKTAEEVESIQKAARIALKDKLENISIDDEVVVDTNSADNIAETENKPESDSEPETNPNPE
ncbi:MAG TPA: transcription termination factor NusA [Thermodesulfobacteriota bacterium]|nr:transcription termination factor NusA [Thermodesulfobacteriota bacterium]